MESLGKSEVLSQEESGMLISHINFIGNHGFGWLKKDETKNQTNKDRSL